MCDVDGVEDVFGLVVVDAVRVVVRGRLEREDVWRRVVGAVELVLVDCELLHDEALHLELHLQVGRLLLLLQSPNVVSPEQLTRQNRLHMHTSNQKSLNC